MPAPASSTRQQLVRALAHASAEHPFSRKLLVARTPAEGRELLNALSADQPWTGWEVTTLLQLAYELAAPTLAAAGLRVGDDFDVQALADEAIDAVTVRGELGPLGERSGIAGLRDAIRSAIGTLRSAGMQPADVRGARPGDPKLAALAAVLCEYEVCLRAAALADPCDVLRHAILTVRAGEGIPGDSRLYIAPGHSLRGLSGQLIQLLREQTRCEVLESDSVLGLPDPVGLLWKAPSCATAPLSRVHAWEPADEGERNDVSLFAAATPADEVREVLRRVVHAGIPWDGVEIVATDPLTYGAALDVLTRRLLVPATFTEGLDIRRTRTGRALGAYLRWIEEGFPSDVLRSLLEVGDLGPPAEYADRVSSTALARRMRRLRIGWGRDRYLPLTEQALDAISEVGDEATTRDPGEAAREKEELSALLVLLRHIIEVTPSSASRPDNPPTHTSPSALAAAALAFLAHVPATDEAERTLQKIYRQRLERIRATLTRQTRADAALSTLRTRLETRIAPTGDNGPASWTSTGGALHLSGISTGGHTGRPHVFVVGLDAARASGGGGSDPLLTEADREVLNRVAADPGDAAAPLPTSAERAAESRHAMAALLARLRGNLTVSYSAWDGIEGRAAAPAPELLQILRLRERDASLLFADLYSALGPLACTLPRNGRCLDGTDVWMDSLASEGHLRFGVPVVRAAFPGLDRGLAAQAARTGVQLTAYHGRITPRDGLDPRGDRGAVFSASRLETLGTCPRRYFYRYVLGADPPDDPEWDVERWLTAAERGALLHAVYEGTLRRARAQGHDIADAAFQDTAYTVLAEEAARIAERCPPPSDAIRLLEMEQLEQDVLCFVALMRDVEPDWRALELRFGPTLEPVALLTPGGPVRVRGAIDRVDAAGPDRFRIVDYKTGRATDYQEREPFRGSRRIQHALYMAAAEQLLGGEVDSIEYSFPTRRGENHRVSYPRAALDAADQVLDGLLSIAAAGLFVATDDADDCRYCDFGTVCRTATDSWGKTSCGAAAWSKSIGAELPEYEPLRKLRQVR